MTVPMLPGIGDTLREKLPGIVRNIRNLINPTAEAEGLLKEAIAKNPQIAQNLAELTADNPDMLTPIFGENASKYIAGIKTSPAFQNQRALQQAEANLTPMQRDEATKHRLGVKTDEERAVFDLGREKLALDVQAGKLTQKQLEDRAGLYEHAATSGLAQAGRNEIINKYIKGEYSSKDIQALSVFAPAMLGEIFDELKLRGEYDMRLKLAKETAKIGNKSLIYQQGLTAIREAKDLGVNAGAYLANLYGNENTKSIWPELPYTDADKKVADEKVRQDQRIKQLGQRQEYLKAYGAVTDKKKSVADRIAAIEYFNQQSEARGIPVKAELVKGSWLPFDNDEIKYTSTLDNKEIPVDQISQVVGGSDREAPISLKPEQQTQVDEFVATYNKTSDADKPKALAALQQARPDLVEAVNTKISGPSNIPNQVPKYASSDNLTNSEFNFKKALNLNISNAELIEYKKSLGYGRSEEIPPHLLEAISKYKLQGQQIDIFLRAKPSKNTADGLAKATLNIPAQ